MDSVTHSGTRRKYVLVGSGTASMLSTVPERVQESIFVEASRLQLRSCLLGQNFKCCGVTT